MLEWARLKPWMWIWVVANLVGLGHWDLPLKMKDRTSSPRLCHAGQLSHTCSKGWMALQWGVGLALVLQWSVKDRARSSRASKWWIHLSTVLRLQHPWPSVVTWAMEINKDPAVPGLQTHKALGNSLDLDVIMAPVAAKATQISMTLMTAWLSDTNIISDGWPDPGCLHSPWWYEEESWIIFILNLIYLFT